MTWLPTKKAAEFEQVSPRTMCRNKEQYVFRPVNGVGGASGTKYEFLLESLSDAAQARYRGEQEQQAADVRLSLTGSQREQLDFKQIVVLDYQDFKATWGC